MVNKSNRDRGQQAGEFVEVLGDTVYGKDLIFSIIGSAFLGMGGFLLGKQIFPIFAAENMINSYSLLTGIAGLVIALIINSFLFKPKRKLIEEKGTAGQVKEIFDDYQLDLDQERKAIRDNPAIMKEMKEQGIYEMFFPRKGD